MEPVPGVGVSGVDAVPRPAVSRMEAVPGLGVSGVDAVPRPAVSRMEALPGLGVSRVRSIPLPVASGLEPITGLLAGARRERLGAGLAAAAPLGGRRGADRWLARAGHC